MRFLQRRQLAAYDWQRSAVAATLAEVSESVMGAPVIRAYGVRGAARKRVFGAIHDQYRANMRAALFFSLLFALSDIAGAIAVGAVLGVGMWWGPGWGMTEGTVVACLFLATLLLTPIGEIGEVLDQTQTALAGWRKILDLLDTPIDLVEPEPGVDLAARRARGAGRGRAVRVRGGRAGAVRRRPRDPGRHQRGHRGRDGLGQDHAGEAPVPARRSDQGTHRRRRRRPPRGVAGVAVPRHPPGPPGRVPVRRHAGRQRAARAGPTRPTRRSEQSFVDLGLEWWLDRLPDGLDSAVGERGDNLSVGERQLVALARAQLADAGLLLLDEATSAVDAETERALSEALTRLAEGRTTVSVAHRLSTAEAADLVVVFDSGRIVEVGPHDELAAGGGRYAALYASWIGNTREPAATADPTA